MLTQIRDRSLDSSCRRQIGLGYRIKPSGSFSNLETAIQSVNGKNARSIFLPRSFTLETMRRALLLVALAGCDEVFAISTQDLPDAGAAYDRCAPAQPDPLRYAAITAAATWRDARAMCRLRGMDLAVLNDAHELAGVDIEIRPFWVGEQHDGDGWTTVDGCPAATELATTGTQCGAVSDDPDAVSGTACDVPLGAMLCETPRPDSATCVATGPSRFATSPSPLTFAEAQAYCTAQHAHLAVIDTQAELLQVSQLGLTASAWLGAKLADGAWTTETGCPGVYSWTNGAPAPGGATACASVTVIDLQVEGMTAASCEADKFMALCELY